MTWASTQSFWSSNNRLTANNCVLSTLYTFCTLLRVSSVSRRGAQWSPTLCPYHSFHPLCGCIIVPPFAKIIYLLCKISVSLFLSLQLCLYHQPSPIINLLCDSETIIPFLVPDLHIQFLIKKNLLYPDWPKCQNRGLMNSKSRRI